MQIEWVDIVSETTRCGSDFFSSCKGSHMVRCKPSAGQLNIEVSLAKPRVTASYLLNNGSCNCQLWQR